MSLLSPTVAPQAIAAILLSATAFCKIPFPADLFEEPCTSRSLLNASSFDTHCAFISLRKLSSFCVYAIVFFL